MPFRRPRVLREAVQAAADQARVHPGGRGPGPRHALRQRLFPDHHLPVRGPAAQFQEHVQADAAAQEVAGGGGLDDRHLGVDRQDRGSGPEAEEADEHRGLDQGRTGAALQQEPEALGSGDLQPGRQPPAGKGGRQGLVLQPEAEGEEDDAAQHGRVPLGRGPDRGPRRRPSRISLRPPPSPRSHAKGPGCGVAPGPVLAGVAALAPAAAAQSADDVAPPHARHAKPLTLGPAVEASAMKSPGPARPDPASGPMGGKQQADLTSVLVWRWPLPWPRPWW